MLKHLAVALVLLATPVLAQDKVVPDSQSQISLSFAPLVKQTAPAVVNVYAKTLVQTRERGMFSDPFFRQFFGDDNSFDRPREQVQNSLGSGVIMGAEGFIVTNNHVINNASDIRVVLADKREFEAKLVLADERTDLAVLKIDAGEDLPALKLADADGLEVGDLVLAIGNPFGVGQTVTSGIVSALARTQVGVSNYQFFIQTDAAINPGNSGGALINMKGEVVGINTAIFSRSGGSIGIGFAIPSNMVATVVQTAQLGNSRIKRPWLGVDLQDVTQDLAESLGFARPEGALVLKLHPESPLRKGGVKRGDVIIGFDGRAIENAQEFGFRVATMRIGESRTVEVRRGAEDLELPVMMVAAPETTPRDEQVILSKSPLQGLRVANLSPAVAEELAMPVDAKGVVALAAEEGLAARFFQKGDVLIGINGEPINDVASLLAVLERPTRRWNIEILRGGKPLLMRLR